MCWLYLIIVWPREKTEWKQRWRGGRPERWKVGLGREQTQLSVAEAQDKQPAEGHGAMLQKPVVKATA